MCRKGADVALYDGCGGQIRRYLLSFLLALLQKIKRGKKKCLVGISQFKRKGKTAAVCVASHSLFASVMVVALYSIVLLLGGLRLFSLKVCFVRGIENTEG